jgi:hypothetical protein
VFTRHVPKAVAMFDRVVPCAKPEMLNSVK